MAYEAFQKGLTKELIEHISQSKQEPQWMKEKRLEAFALFEKTPLPTWGPELTKLDLKDIVYYINPEVAEATRWDELPYEITETFTKLGIPKAEQEYLGGVGAQYDSNVVYHKLKESLLKDGVIFENMDTALKNYPDMVEKYFMNTCVPAGDHKFTMLHGAVWSGGTFIYIPKGVKVAEPLQAYFRMNRSASGQFEHTLIIADEGAEVTYIEGCSAPRYNASSLHAGCVELFVHPHAKIKYISVENWSRNTYNLNTKRAIVEAYGEMNWVSGNMGSAVTMLYPCSVLKGEGSKSDNLSLVFAGKGQVQDTGAKAIHLAPHTSSTIRSKSVSKDGGISNYRGLIKVTREAVGASASLVCDSLLLDSLSEANTFPAVKNKQDDVMISHEATIGRIGEEELFYLESRGLSRDDAIRMIISGFVNPITKALPLEYAVEFNKLIELEMDPVRDKKN
ncbi:TPA: Fe-S cluster assembly protein SufB [Patescibacteria group bacterium]|nr:MAG: FeS assembly protein SufB [Parcubacteria group bacterium GW2011_GWD2_42_14]HCC05106.1 Fe-S cluster assembly protein SufB [Patescibacteria group bacterium]